MPGANGAATPPICEPGSDKSAPGPEDHNSHARAARRALTAAANALRFGQVATCSRFLVEAGAHLDALVGDSARVPR